MGKNYKKEKTNERGNGFRVPREVRDFYSMKLKEFRENNSDIFMTKKDAKKLFKEWRLEQMGDVIRFLIKCGHIPEAGQAKEKIYEIIGDYDFIEAMKKDVKKGTELVADIDLFPIVAYDMIRGGLKYKEEHPDDDKAEYDKLDELIELVKMINQKKIKKLVKKGINEDLAFDLCCVLPSPERLITPRGAIPRIKMMFLVIYEHAKAYDINIEAVFDTLLKHANLIPVLSFALLERKEKYLNFTDTQKEVFNKISIWVFDKMEDMDKEDIALILREYFNARKRDKAKNQDAARRYYIGSLPEDKYPRVLGVLKKMKENDETLEEFL